MDKSYIGCADEKSPDAFVSMPLPPLSLSIFCVTQVLFSLSRVSQRTKRPSHQSD